MTMATAKHALLLVALLAGSSYGASSSELRGIWTQTERAVQAAAESFIEEDLAAPVIHALRSADALRVPCSSWRLAVETGNIIDWKTVPAHCQLYIRNYMLQGHYNRDSKVVTDEAIAYTSGFKLRGNDAEEEKKKWVWLFDIDETTLSSIPYYATHGFGTKPHNSTSFRNYVLEGTSPVLPETLRLYKTVLSRGIKPVFISTRKEDLRNVTEANLHRAGYSDWFKLLLKPVDYNGTIIVYKTGERKKLQKAGYLIVGSIADQWNDLIGEPEGERLFKLPNPLCYEA
ncbi:unnamed protein product [Urochloa humidicola]